MRLYPLLLFLTLALSEGRPAHAAPTGKDARHTVWERAAQWISPTWQRLEAERITRLASLQDLPSSPERHLTERLGFHSGYSPSADTVEWVQMHLHHAGPIDAVVLIPAASNSGGAEPAGYGFPVRFRVELILDSPEEERQTLADYTHEDFANPGTLPVYLPAYGVHARSIRITATRLFQDGERFVLALGEVMVLRGPRNIVTSLQRQDFTESRTTGALPVWGLTNLVDGHTVLGPPLREGTSPTLGYQSQLVNLQQNPTPEPRWVQVDLGTPTPIEEVRLFPANPPSFAHRQGFGYPPRSRLLLSNDPDFNQASVVAGFADGDLRPSQVSSPGNNAVTYDTRGEVARYVRLSALELHNANGQYNLALAEMQVWSGGRNVALHQPVTAYDSLEKQGWSRAALVDGYTSQGQIAEWPEWLAGLSQRREIQQHIATISTHQSQVIQQLQHRTLLGSGAVLAALITLPLVGMIRQRHARQKELEMLRQRISQDLHDEIGSSLGSITLVARDALGATTDPHLQQELQEIDQIAQQTLDSMRDIVRLAQANKYGQGDLTEHLREIADRMLRHTPHQVQTNAQDGFNRLPMQVRRDLVLMYKEILHNVIKHSHATNVSITLDQDRTGGRSRLRLILKDNGIGFDPATSQVGMGLANLQRRASKHGGSVHIHSTPSSTGPHAGTTITIELPTHDRL